MKKYFLTSYLVLFAGLANAQWNPTSGTQFITTSHVSGTGDYGFSLDNAGTNAELFIVNNLTGVNRQVFYFGHANTTGNIFGIGTSSNSGGSWQPLFAMTQDGNVGIGTSTPSARFEVIGDLSASWQIRAQHSIVVNKGGAYRVAMNGVADGYIRGRNDAVEDKFFINSNGVSYFNGGSVGIGTTDPGTLKLAVEGKIGGSEVIVTLQRPWPDYIFENDYSLPSLFELEQYIKTNKHLPDVPTAQDVKENGLSLGEMNAILLKKIEELTLYMIELKKENAQIKKQLKIN